MKRPRRPIKAKRPDAQQPLPDLNPNDIVRVRFTGGFKESITDMRFKLYLWFRQHQPKGSRLEIIERTKDKPDRDWTYEPPIAVNAKGESKR